MAGARADEATASRAQLTAAEDTVRNRSTDWSAWRIDRGVPTDLSPQGVLAFFDRVRVGRDRLLDLEAAERETAAEMVRIGAYEARTRDAIVATGGSTVDAGALGDAVVDLSREVARNRAVQARRDELGQTVARCDRAITDVLGEGLGAAAMRADLATGDTERWRSDAAAAEDEITEIEDARVVAIETRVKAIHERDAIAASSDIARLELEHAALTEEIQSAVDEWRVLSLAEGLIKSTLEKFERERQPEVLLHASRLFEAITAGEYTRLYRKLGEDSGLSITTRDSRVVGPEALSQGTREQLYLCVRLGLAADHAARTSSLPLVMDDVLVNFDPDRASAVAEVLCDFSRDHQVLLFTCHPHTVDLLRSIQPVCGHFAMQRFGAGGEWVASA